MICDIVYMYKYYMLYIDIYTQHIIDLYILVVYVFRVVVLKCSTCVWVEDFVRDGRGSLPFDVMDAFTLPIPQRGMPARGFNPGSPLHEVH